MAGFSHTAWSRGLEIAAGQWGCATLAQLSNCGLSGDALEEAVLRGHLLRPHKGVYCFGPITTPHARAMAAVLSCGGQALLSHRWCLWLFGLLRFPPNGPVDVTTQSLSGRTDVIPHRTRLALTPDRNHGIPCTRPERAILDSVGLLTPKQLRRAVNQGQVDRLFTAATLREMVATTRGRKTRTLGQLVPLDQRGATRSLLEDLLFDLCRAQDWARPDINEIVEGIECDFVFRDRRVILEADGWFVHGTRIAFENDHEIRLMLEAARWRVIPVTYRMVTQSWTSTRDRLARVLGVSSQE
ncbi:MAG: hypothetical protein QOF76_2437 [Solirubrobacteraceae bacterium]|jgi:hypothetical protein|nr:hypothetical protein [Solirubrobacteraceae bacterium]